MAALQRNPTQRWQSAAQLRSALASMAAPASELWRWIEWALAQPLTAHAWDEGPATRIGAAPAPALRPPSPPVETVASKAKTLFVGDARPVFAAPVPVPVPVPDLNLGATLIPTPAQQHQMATVISLPPISAHPGTARPRIGALSIALVVLLCATAAVGGFFLVDALM